MAAWRGFVVCRRSQAAVAVGWWICWREIMRYRLRRGLLVDRLVGGAMPMVVDATLIDLTGLKHKLVTFSR